MGSEQLDVVSDVGLGLVPFHPHNEHLVPPGVCGSTRDWSAPGVCGLAAPHSVGPAVFLGSPRQPATHLWSLLECAAQGRSSQCGTRGVFFLGSPPTLNTPLVPPGVCGAWPLLAVRDPRFPRAYRQTTHLINYSQHSGKGIVIHILGVKMPTQTYRHAQLAHTKQRRL